MKSDLLINGVRVEKKIGSADLLNGRSLEQAVLLSLFCDRRLDDSEPAIDGYRGGSWSDVHPAMNGDKSGSLLWTLRREKATQDTANRAREQTASALLWLIEDGVATSVSVNTSYPSFDVLLIEVNIRTK